jgi:SAM-dependent methyltransferase
LIPDFTFDLPDGRLTWDRCEDCGLIFQNPRLTERTIRDLYSIRDYFGRQSATSSTAYVDYIRYDPIRIEQSRRRLARIVNITGIRRGRLLDLGSASGFFAVAAREAGFEVTCVEPDAELAAYGRERYGLTFMATTLETCCIEREQYEVVTLWGADSCLLHPLHSFQKLVGALRPGGVLAMTSQDFDHWIRRIFPRTKTGWNIMFNLSHRSLDVLLQKLGLTLVYRGLEWQTVTVDHALRVLRIPLPSFFRHGVVRVPAVSIPLIVARK